MDPKILRGSDTLAPPFDVGFGEYFFEKAGTIGNKIFQIDGNTEEVETYAETRRRSTRIALVLKDFGLGPKDVCLLCCNSGLHNIIPILATMYLGGYASSVDPRQTVSDVTYLISLVKPKIIFVEDFAIELIESSVQDLEIKPRLIVIGSSEKYPTMLSLEGPHEGEATFVPVKQKGSDTTLIQFSSGTTSSPKGICISNEYALCTGRNLIEHGTAKPGVMMHMSSFYWISAPIVTGCCIISDSAKVVGTNISGERFLQLVEKFKITYLFGSNTFSYQITGYSDEVVKKYDTSSLYSILIGGAYVQSAQLLRLRELLPHTYVAMAYGSTEASFISAFDFKDRNAYHTKLTASGTLPPSTQLKVVDTESGDLLGPNKIGEIRVKAAAMMNGYYNLNIPDAYDEDGFLKVGDLGYYDDDHYIYVTGRINEVFKYQTTQIVPADVENIILSHPDVKEAVVFGVPHLADNNHPAAVVVLKQQSRTSVNDLIKFTDSRLAAQKRLRGGILIVDDIPKTPSGKVQRRSVRDEFIQRLSTGV